MNADPSDFQQLTGASSLSKPGFDILRAVSSARQAASTTARLIEDRATRDAHREQVNALTHLLAGAAPATEQNTRRPVRFFDLSDDANGLPENMNGLFTRGFQPMLNPSDIAKTASVPPIPPTLK